MEACHCYRLNRRRDEQKFRFLRDETGAFAAVEEEAPREIAAAVEPGVLDGEAGGFGDAAEGEIVEEVEAGGNLIEFSMG